MNNYTSLINKIFITLNVCSITLSLQSTTAEIPLYPTPTFSKIESLCKELKNDFDVLNFTQLFHKDWLESSDYLFQKFLVMNSSIIHLVNNTEESKAFLLEDIHYLLTIIIDVRAYFNKIFEYSRNPICISINTLLQKSEEKLGELLLINQEIVA